mmetsp:Transcript_21384/g.50151  ORF Transcript_21384/g.50151 Transcript_21384/m.50151 type:complete len:216 (+) Transcript_21384:52-699(+)
MGDPAVFARTGPDGAEDYLELGLLVIEQLFFLFLEELHDIPLQQQLLALTLQVLRFEERRTSAKGEGGAHHRTQVRQSRPALRAIPRSKAKPRAPHLIDLLGIRLKCFQELPALQLDFGVVTTHFGFLGERRLLHDLVEGSQQALEGRKWQGLCIFGECPVEDFGCQLRLGSLGLGFPAKLQKSFFGHVGVGVGYGVEELLGREVLGLGISSEGL